MSQFDSIVDRKNSNSLKYDFAVERGKPEDILPLWVADMDFKAPRGVTDALVKAAEHGIFGYTEVKSDYYEAVSGWFERHFSWKPEETWLVKTPGVVFAIATAIRAFTKEGDAVLIQKPVYYPFSEVILTNNRKLVNSPLVYENGAYYIDFKDFEKKIAENKVRLFILCSPHNPVGRVWTKGELLRMGEICRKYGVLVVSDEIHCDFTYTGYTHTVFSTIQKEFREISIICTAPSKTFNLAGLQNSNIWIANELLRKEFIRALEASGYSQLNTMGLVAAKAAYEHGEAWLLELKEYLEENLTFVREFLQEKLPQVKLVEPQGTYLIWLDFRELGISDQEIKDRVVNQAGLWLDSGTMFGEEGEYFQRINIACPRSVLKEAMGGLVKVTKL